MILNNCFCIHWNCECFWAGVTAFFTLGLLLVGYFQLRALNNTNTQTFLQDLKNDFFNDYERIFMFLIEHNALKFSIVNPEEEIANQYAFFENTLDAKFEAYTSEIPLSKRKYFSTNEIDDFLLMHFEDLGLLFEKKDFLTPRTLTIYQIDQYFGYYLKTCWENEDIQIYISWARKASNDNDIYSKFENINSKIKEYNYD